MGVAVAAPRRRVISPDKVHLDNVFVLEPQRATGAHGR